VRFAGLTSNLNYITLVGQMVYEDTSMDEADMEKIELYEQY